MLNKFKNETIHILSYSEYKSESVTRGFIIWFEFLKQIRPIVVSVEFPLLDFHETAN